MFKDDKVTQDPTGMSTALTAAELAAGLLGTLGLASGSIACAGVAAVGILTWFAFHKIKAHMATKNLTPDGPAYACGMLSKLMGRKRTKGRG